MEELEEPKQKVDCLKTKIIEENEIENYIDSKFENVIFDSDRDNWSRNTSVFVNKIMGKSRLTFIIEDEERNEKFGYYLNTQVVDNYREWLTTDKYSFMFNLYANGRLFVPIKYEIKDVNYGFGLFNSANKRLIGLGEIKLYKQNDRQCSWCYQHDELYNYHGVEKAICGRTMENEPFTIKRIVVIQME